MTKKTLTLLILLISVLLVSCNAPKTAWEQAKSANTIESYRAYLKNYPGSSGYVHELTVHGKIDNLLFLAAQKANTASAYEEYLNAYPMGENVKKARTEHENLLMSGAQKANTFEAYKNYLQRYPYGKYALTAKIGLVRQTRAAKLVMAGESEQTPTQIVTDVMKAYGIKIVPMDSNDYDLLIRLEWKGTPVLEKWQYASYIIERYTSAHATVTADFKTKDGWECSEYFSSSKSLEKDIHLDNYQSPNNAPFPYSEVKGKFFSFLGDVFGYNILLRVPAVFESLPSEKAFDAFLLGLKEEDPVIRKFAAEKLGEMKTPAAINPLIATLKDKEKDVCRSAAEALGYIGDSRALDPLVEILKETAPPADNLRKNDPLTLYRIRILLALSQINAPNVESVINEVRLKDRQSQVRAWAERIINTRSKEFGVSVLYHHWRENCLRLKVCFDLEER